MRGAIAGLLALLAGPVQADPFDLVDFDDLFRARAAELTGPPGQEKLALPSGIIIARMADGSYASGDFSAAGPVGCLFRQYAEIDRLLRSCPGSATAAEEANLARYLDRIGGFVAENAWPPRDWPTLRAEVQARPADPAMCVEHDATMIALIWLGDSIAQDIDRALAVPRLPMFNSCRSDLEPQ